MSVPVVAFGAARLLPVVVVVPALTWSLPDTATVGVAIAGSIVNTSGVDSGPWSLNVPVGWTVSPSSGSSIAAGATVSISITASGAGSASFTLTCAGASITGNPQGVVASAPAVTPTTATLSGSGLATTDVAHTDTVTLDHTADVAYTVTWSRSDGGTGPATSTIAVGQTTASGSSTWAAAGAGRTVGFTISPSLTLAGTPLSVTVSDPVSSADWATRSSGAAVVWAHNFEADAEVTQHLLAQGPADDAPVPCRRVVDEAGYGCLEQIVLGATLAAPFTAGATSMVIDDATHWPDPAVTGVPFKFIVAKAYPATPDKNLFNCTARSGTTLTVAYVGGQGSAFAATAQSYSVGDYAGNESSRDWRRTFAALPAGENGKATDDPGASGAVPLRSKLTGNAYSVPRDASYWQYGWYGHPDNQATWADWTGWVGTTPLTPRGVSQGAAAKYRLWDGAEFWIQFRLKIDPRLGRYHQQPATTTNYWIRKAWALQSEVSSTNQLVVDVGPPNTWYLPATRGLPFTMRTYKDTRVVGGDDDPARVHKSFQLGSPWDVAPHYADLSASGKPAFGAPTPDGSTAWKPPEGEWITFLVRVKPGHSGVSDSLVEVKYARQDEPGYDGTYTTLLSCTDGRIIFSGSGDYDYPDGAFSYPAVQRMDALPGFQSFGPMGYLNLFQAAGWVPPKRSYYLRMAQVIFSQAPIPAPEAPALPAYVPAAGAVARIAQGAGVLTNNFRSIVPSYYSSVNSCKTVNDYSSTPTNPWMGTHGGLNLFGAGHASGNGNLFGGLVFGATSISFNLLNDPTNWFPAEPLRNDQDAAANDASHVDFLWGDALTPTVDSQPKPMAMHSWGTGEVIPPRDGGAARGSYFIPMVTAPGHPGVVPYSGGGSSGVCPGPHYMDVANDAGTAGNVWRRGGALWGTTGFQGWGGPLCSAYVDHQKRSYWTIRNRPWSVDWFDHEAQAWGTNGSGIGFTPADDPDCGRLLYIPWRGLLLWLCRRSGQIVVQWLDVSVANPTMSAVNANTATLSAALYVPPTGSGIIPGSTSNGSEWIWNHAEVCHITKKVVVGKVLTGGAWGSGGSLDTGALYEMDIPATLTSTWTVTRRAFAGGATVDWGQSWQGLRWMPALRSVALLENVNPVAGSDALWLLRPTGT